MDGQTDSEIPQVSLPWETKVNRNRFKTYSYSHCQPTFVHHYCSLPPLISLTDAHIKSKAFDIFILYLLISRAYFFSVIHPVPAIKTELLVSSRPFLHYSHFFVPHKRINSITGEEHYRFGGTNG